MPTSVTMVRVDVCGSLDRESSTVVPAVSWTAVSDVPRWRQLAAELSWNDGRCITNYQLDGADAAAPEWPFKPLLPGRRGTLLVRVLGVDGWSAWSDDVIVDVRSPVDDLVGLR